MVLKLIFTLVFFNLLLAGLGQSNVERAKMQFETDLRKDLSDSVRQNLCYDFANLFLSQKNRDRDDLDSAIFYLRNSVNLFDSSSATSNAITNRSLCLLGEIYFQIGNLDEGKRHFTQAITTCQNNGDKITEAETWHRQGAMLLAIDRDIDCIQLSYERAMLIYTQLNKEFKKIDVGLELAYFYFRQDKSTLAEKQLLSILEQSKKNGSYKLPTVYVYLSQVKRYAGALNEGLNYALNAVKAMAQNRDSTEAHTFYGELALEYQELDKPDESIYWYKKCIEERIKKKYSNYAIYRTVYLMVVQMIKVGREKEALQILQALKKSNPLNSQAETAVFSQSLAYCYNTLKEYSLTEKYFLSMIKDYSKEESNGEVLFIANYDIGQFYVNRQRYAEAEPYLQKAFELSISPTISRVRDLHLSMFKVDSAKGSFLSAINHYQKFKVLNDSIFDQAKNKQLQELLIKYETEKKDKSIKLLENASSLQQSKLIQAKQTSNWIIGAAILLLIITILLINNSRHKQQANRKLRLQQSEIEKKNISLQHLVEEKEWLVKEIHHRVKNNFHIVIGLLGTHAGYLKNEEAIAAMAESQQRIQAMSLIHQKLYQSENMSDIDMADYIHELVDYLKDSLNTDRRIQFLFQLDRIELGVYDAVPIGLILNEAITNAVKYAFPENSNGKIRISFTAEHGNENSLLLVVEDNGIGLPAGVDNSSNSTMGMNLMNGLAKDIDGRFNIHSSGGTTVKIAFLRHRDIPNNHIALAKDPRHIV